MEKTQEQKNRLEWIDVLKGVAIILVYLGHSLFPQLLRTLIYAFHMPLFFFLSGITLNVNIDIKTFAKKRIKGILVPLVWFSLIDIVSYKIIYQYFIGHNIALREALSLIPGIALQSRLGYFSGVLWFLPCLFVSEILIYFICKVSPIKQKLVIILGVICSFIWIYVIGIRLPWCMDIVFIATLFIYLGKICSTNKTIFEQITKIWLFIPYMIVLTGAALCNSKYFIEMNTVNMAFSIYGNCILFLIASLSGILMMVSIFKNVRLACEHLRYIGQNSIIYYGFNQVAMIIPSVFTYQILARFIDINNSVIQFFIGIGYLIFSLPLVYIAAEIINKKMPFMLGKNFKR